MYTNNQVVKIGKKTKLEKENKKFDSDRLFKIERDKQRKEKQKALSW